MIIFHQQNSNIYCLYDQLHASNCTHLFLKAIYKHAVNLNHHHNLCITDSIMLIKQCTLHAYHALNLYIVSFCIKTG